MSLERINSINFSFPSHRVKRAIFPQLGSVIKTITGNLDATDSDKYDFIIQDLFKNEDKLQKQLDLQYTLNGEAVKRFELTVQNIQHNEEILKNKILQLGQIFTEEGISSIMIAEDAFHQLIALYNSFLTILQDIQNSLTFCRAKIYHPSILSPSQLLNELNKLKIQYGNRIPLDINSISDLQRILNVDCKVQDSKIIYFLSFPINYITQYDLYFLMSIPSLNDVGFTTIIPRNHYLLKSTSLIKPLNDVCEVNNSFQCFQRNIANNLGECEKQILQGGNPDPCEHITLEISENYIDFIPQINMFIVVFPFREAIKMEFENEIEIKELQGIYLIESNQGNLIFRNEVLTFTSKAKGKPTILSNVKVRINEGKLSELKIKVYDLNLNDIKLNQLIPTNQEIQKLDINFKWWKLYTCLSIVILLLILLVLGNKVWWKNISQMFKSKISNEHDLNMIPTSNTGNPSPVPGLYPKIHLPGDAKL